MFKFDTSDMQRFAVSAVGALAVSAATLFVAAGPVKAATPTVAAWEAQVADKIDAAREPGAVQNPTRMTKAEVAADFTADGDFAGARLARSSGNRVIDGRALKVANRIAYPPLPAGLRGTPQTIRLNLYFGDVDGQANDAALKERQARLQQGRVQIAGTDRVGTQMAAR
jgi:hypothetical protein